MSALANRCALGLFAAGALLAAGCKNAVYFYETDKVALSLEARPDPSQPISGTFGYKQRVAAVVPSKLSPPHEGPQEAEASGPAGKGTQQASGPRQGETAPELGGAKSTGAHNNHDAQADAVSVISYFDFDKADGPGLNDPITIRSGLITGRAASSLDYGQASRAMVALTSAGTSARGAAMSSMTSAIRLLAQHFGADGKVKGLLQASEVDMAAIATTLEPFVSVTWNKDAGKLGDERVIAVPPPEKDSRTPQLDVIATYRGELDVAVTQLEAWATAHGYTLEQAPRVLDATPIADEAAAKEKAAAAQRTLGHWALWVELDKRLRVLDTRIADSAATCEAFETYIEFLRTGAISAAR